MTEPGKPTGTRCSMRLAMQLTGLGRSELRPLMTPDHRGFTAINLPDLEALVGHPIDLKAPTEEVRHG
jgi:hypothetical protein